MSINTPIPPSSKEMEQTSPMVHTPGESTSEPISVETPYTAFSRHQKWFIIVLASISATFSGFASNIYFPSIPLIAKSLNTTISNINLTVTSYMIFQAISPTFWGAVSDVYGRRLTLLCTFIVFLSACIGLALSNQFYQLIILRCLQSTGSASTIAIGAGMIGDITTREERGGYMGIFQAGALAPLAIGPIIGGVLADSLGWRSIFWFLVIYSGTYLIILFLFLPETLRSIVDDGSKLPYKQARSPFERFTSNRARQDQNSNSESEEAKDKKLKIDFIAPIKILFQKEVICILLFLSIHYATWQMSLTIQSTLFSEIYKLNEIKIGLTFLSNGLGCILGTLVIGKILNRNYQKLKASFLTSGLGEEEFPIEKARLTTIWILSPIQIISIIIFSWTIDKHKHISIPIISSFFLSFTSISIQTIISTFLVDIFPKKSASANATLNLIRCAMGAIATGTINPSINRIGIGWSFMIWSGMMIASLGLLFVQMKCGPRWRKERELREKSQVER